MMDPCDSLHAYVDGELDEAKTAEFEVHLATCERCLAELPRLLALLDSLDGAGELARVKPPQLTVVDGGRGPGVAAAPAAAATGVDVST
ncbi:MAG TPA: zf-HC2 domain-containing protein, partial [Kofleriaceae bacterium]